MKKITVLVNKNWETEGVMSSLVNTGLHPQELPFPAKLYTPSYTEITTSPRAEFYFGEENPPTLAVTLRCIQDSMYFDDQMDPAMRSGSSSAEKYRILPGILSQDAPDLVISISTAGYPAEFSANGSVVLGGNFFLYNGNPHNPKSKLDIGGSTLFLGNTVNPRVFSLIDTNFKNSTEAKFLHTPRNPAAHPCCLASQVFCALSIINVTEYEEYNWADHEGLAEYKRRVEKLPCNSAETTHGVVKLSVEKFRPGTPLIFLSPITDQFGHFDFEVTPTQNFAASFNAGIVLAHFLCALNSFVKSGGEFAL